MDQNVVSPAVPRRRLPRLPALRLPGHEARQAKREDEAASAALIPTYRRGGLGPVATGILLVLLSAACIYYGWLFASMAPKFMIAFVVPPALFMMFLVWALPAGEYAPTRTMIGFFWAFFVAFVLWPNYIAVALPGLPWLTLTRFINPPMVLALLISVSVSKVFRDQIAACLNNVPLVWKSLVAYLAIVTLTMPMAGGAIGVSINKFVILLTSQISIYFISIYAFLKPRRLERWVYLLLVMDALLCAIGLWENKLGIVPWAGHIPSFLKIEDDTITRLLVGSSRAAIGIHRVQSVQTTPLGFAELLGMSIPFALHMAINRYPFVIRVLCAGMIGLIVYSIILTDSRLGFVSVLVEVALYLLLWALVRWREVRGSIFGPAIVLSYPGIFIALVSATLLIGKVRAKVWGNGAQAASNEGRKTQWRAGIPKIIHNPIGHGYGTAGHALGVINPLGLPSIDSYYLNLLMDTGVLGFGAYMTFFLSTSYFSAKQVIRAPGERETRLLIPLSVILVGYLVIKAVLSQDANHPLAFFLAGAAVATIHRSRQNALRAEKAVATPR